MFPYTRSIGVRTTDNSDQGMIDMAMKASGAEVSEEDKKIVADLERDTNNNFANIFFKEENWSKVIEKSTKSIAIEKNAKGYYNRGRAYAMKNDYENAYKDFEEGKSLFSDKTKLFTDEIKKAQKREKGKI